MADNHDIVLGFVELAPGSVRYRYLFERCTTFERELGESEDLLVDELGENWHEKETRR